MKYIALTIKKTFRYLLKPLSFVPALCMMYVIYSFSAQPAVESSQLSMEVGEKLISSTSNFLNLGLDPSQIAYYTASFQFYIRKLAHITEYFLLAVSVTLPLYVYRIRGFRLIIIAGIFCVGFASLDEFHQYFVAGRTATPRDVGIDSIGIFIGIYATRIFGFLGRKTIFAPLSLQRAER